MGKVRIKAGARVGQDFTQKEWPIGEADKDTVFDACEFHGGRAKCTAIGFGVINGRSNDYGCGALYVKHQDLMDASTNAHIRVELDFVPVEERLPAVNDVPLFILPQAERALWNGKEFEVGDEYCVAYVVDVEAATHWAEIPEVLR